MLTQGKVIWLSRARLCVDGDHPSNSDFLRLSKHVQYNCMVKPIFNFSIVTFLPPLSMMSMKSLFNPCCYCF